MHHNRQTTAIHRLRTRETAGRRAGQAENEIITIAPTTNETGDTIGRQAWSNATHASVIDPDAPLDRKAKGRPAQLCYMAHTPSEERHGLVVETQLTLACGRTERTAAITMIDPASPG